MPDIRAVLKSRGVSDDVAESMIGNPAYTSILEGFIADAENGKTALLKAQEIETNLKKWNEEQVIPYGQKKDQEAATARAEAAKYKTYLSELKAQGYEIPESYLEAPSAADPTKTTPPAAKDYSEDILTSAKANMALISMSEKARDLLGHGLDVESEYEDFSKNKRPNENLRTYIDRKYDLSAKAQAKAAEKAAAERKTIEEAAIEKYKRENPRSASPDLAPPAASKFDKFKTVPDERRNAWQTREGREASTSARQEKYANFLVQ